MNPFHLAQTMNRYSIRKAAVLLAIIGSLLATALQGAPGPDGENPFTETVLSDGKVLVLGGSKAASRDPKSGREVAVPGLDLRSLSGHSATLLTDGRVLIAGGTDSNGVDLALTVVFDPVAGDSSVGPAMNVARSAHTARLLPSGAVLFEGGARSEAMSEVFDPSSGTMAFYTEALRQLHEVHFATDEPVVVKILPPHESRGVDVEEFVAIRFSRPVDDTTINGESLTLFGPSGAVPANVVSAEGGMLAFITATQSMMPGARYSVFVQGVASADGKAVPFFVSSFETARVQAPPPRVASGPSIVSVPIENDPSRVHPLAHLRWPAISPSADPEIWTPDQESIDGKWHDRRPLAKRNLGPTPHAADGVTALAGRVLRLDGEPLPEVTLRFGTVEGITDKSGSFLLADVKPGYGVLEIDGGSASARGTKYGSYFVRLKVEEGRTTELPYTVWMPKLDPRGTVRISSPTTDVLIVAKPAIPGLEVRIPAGTVIRDRDNRVVTEVNLTAVPVNRPPFPIPELDVPVYFTVQPGGAWLQGVDAQSFKGARIFYPNFKKTLPGTKGLFFNYDPLEKEWYVYGHGTISPDGLQAVPDPGVTIYEFTGAMFTDGPAAPPAGPKPCSSDCCIFVGSPPQGSGDSGGTGDGGGGGGGGGSGDGDGGDGEGSWEKVVLNDKPGCEGVGDPVSASTGYFIHSERDLYLTDVIPIDLTRTYRSQDNSKRSFGLGWSTAYDMILSSENYFQEVDLILPSGGRIHFVRVSPGTGFVDAIFESVGIGKWFRARLERNNVRQGWDLILRDGTRWYFPQYQPVSEITNVNGNTLIVTRRDNNGTTGPIKRIQSPNGRYVEFTLDGSGRIAEAKDNIGRTFTYTYDASGRLTKATDPMSGERNYTYDANHRLLTVKDPRSIVGITNEYDANGRIFRQTLADSNTLQYAYTITSGKVSRTDVTDQRGKVRRIEFGTDGYITKSTSAYGTADAQETNFTVNSLGQITAKTDPLGRTTAYTYDGWGNRLTVTRLYGTANAVTTTFTYTSGGKRLATVTDPLNHTTTFTYDAWGRLATVTDPLSQSVTFTRDSQGRKLTVTDALSHTWTYSYSGADLATVTDPLSRTTQFFSDASGRLMAVKDPSGSSRTVEYDVLNRLKKAIDPLIGAAEFSYDANGNLTSHKDQNNNTTTYSYNDLSLRTGKTDALTRAESYAYGVNGRVSRITDRKSQVTGVTYDNLNRVSQVGFGATVSNPTNYTSTIDYTYDAGNRVTQMVDSVGGTITRAYDDLNRLTQEQTPDGTISYTYDSAGRRATMTVTGQSVVSYTWDNANRLTQIAQGSDTIVFTHDNANRRTKTTLANGVEIAYGYDSSNQLTSIAYSKTGTPIGDLVYTYDSAGRRTKVSGSLARVDLPTAVASASHNANNQLTSWAGNTYDYDLNGNLTSDGTSTYSWDARDQLSSIAGGAAASFGYDAVGRRRTKTVSSTQTGFVFDGATFVQELTGSSVKANLIAGGIDEVFLRREGSTTRHPITDALGSIIALTSNSGTLATEYSFEPYGKTSTTGGADSNTQSFTGREDDGTGLLYYRARYYMPGCGRFISEDPIGTAGGINLYRYVGSSPMNLSDPFGLRPLSNCEKDNLSDFIPKEDLDNANLRDGDPPKWLRKDKDAVTIGNDIRTKKKFDESNAGDLGLLGHELVHVGQFRNGMTVGDYIWESMKNGTGTDNKFENPAYEKQREIGKALTQKHGSGPICK